MRTEYGAIAQTGSGCCGPGCCATDGADTMAPSYAAVEGVVADADLGLGCGLPTEHAGLRPGQTVLDLGSGAGNDAFVAARIVGPEGLVLGVDLTPEMVALARRNAERAGIPNTRFIEADIESLPLPSLSVDVAISNCVLNLVPDKHRAFSEIFRVLRPGGHFCVSDIVVTGTLPRVLRESAEFYVGCVSGALERDAYLTLIRSVGFENVEVVAEHAVPIPDALLDAPHVPHARTAFSTSQVGLRSVTVRGTRPASGW